MSINYEYDENAASHADDVANRIDSNGMYVGVFKRVSAVESSKGTKGVSFEFDAPGGGSAEWTCWTAKQDEDGNEKTLFGLNQVQAMMSILGVKGLRSKTGKVSEWIDGKKAEVDGERFFDLEGKNIGVVLQKELYSKDNGGEGYRMNLFGTFHAETKLTASEIRERKTEPKKLEKMVSSVKTKDSRINKTNESAQPSIGVEAGSY